MRRFFIILFPLLLPFGAGAHEHWIDVECFYPDPAQEVDVRLCSGHHFPKSAFVLKDQVVSAVAWRSPDGTEAPIETREGEKERVGTVTSAIPGAHLVSFVLKRPRAPQPSYEGKAIVVVGSETGVDAYARGHGLELVPQRLLSDVAPGDVLPVSLCLDGREVAGPVSASRAGGKTSLLTTDVDRPAQLKLSGPGRYLVTASHNGRGCSLVFMVTNGPADTEEP